MCVPHTVLICVLGMRQFKTCMRLNMHGCETSLRKVPPLQPSLKLQLSVSLLSPCFVCLLPKLQTLVCCCRVRCAADLSC